MWESAIIRGALNRVLSKSSNRHMELLQKTSFALSCDM